MSETRNVKVIKPDGETVTCRLEIATLPPWKLMLSGIELSATEFVGPNLFAAFTDLRRELEKFGCRILCAGARPDVYPSGMASSMGAARKAYYLPMGQPAREVVDIFDDAPSDKIGSVEEQREYKRKWGDSF